jgi:hypothetical protein
VITTTFNFSSCMVIDNPHSCIVNVHSTVALSSSSINTHVGPILQFLILWFRWSNREVSNIPHDLFTFHKEWIIVSTTSVTSSKAWSIHVDLFVLGGCSLAWCVWRRCCLSYLYNRCSKCNMCNKYNFWQLIFLIHWLVQESRSMLLKDNIHHFELTPPSLSL